TALAPRARPSVGCQQEIAVAVELTALAPRAPQSIGCHEGPALAAGLTAPAPQAPQSIGCHKDTVLAAGLTAPSSRVLEPTPLQINPTQWLCFCGPPQCEQTMISLTFVCVGHYFVSP